jgi:hypothetical protein
MALSMYRYFLAESSDNTIKSTFKLKERMPLALILLHETKSIYVILVLAAVEKN